MKDEKQLDKPSMSLSQTRKMNRKKEIEQMKRDAKRSKIMWVCAIAVISVGIVSLIGYNVYRGINRVKPSSDFSAYLTDDGLIKDVTATSHLNLVDYTNITVPLSEVEYSDEAVEKNIKELLNEKATLSEETDALIADGDKVNIDYTGTIDGVKFEGGSTDGKGADLEIGSGNFIEGFEEQLIGHSIGDKVNVEVTFPEDYNNADVAGKDAVFEVIVNGIYVAPELTDEYVKENLSEFATTAAEYREYVKQSNYDKNLATWLDKHMMEETTVISYPEKYTKHLKSLQKYQDQSEYEYMSQLYASMGYAGPASFEQYIEMSEAKYDAGLEELAEKQAMNSLIYQAICEKEGLTVTEDDYTGDDFDANVKQYGKGFVMQNLVKQKAMERVKELITVK